VGLLRGGHTMSDRRINSTERTTAS
jgi:hypothetical protein